jgi:LacI family transcriptional regulator
MADEITIRDIAKLSGVSYSTVSRALSGVDKVKDSTRDKVLEAAEQLGYVVNRQARSLAGGNTHIIGLLVHGLDNDYFGQLLKGIDEELGRANFEIMLFTTHRHKDKEISLVTRLMRGLTDGLLIVLPEGLESYLETLQAENIPYVLVDTPNSDGEGTTVSSTNTQGAYDATRYLLELGHRQIGFITGSLNLQVAVNRFDGYRRALEEYQVPFDIGLVREGNFLQHRGREAALDLLGRKVRPTAIFASNDASAFGVMEAAEALNISVPYELSVIGFDDLPISEYAKPKLTTVRQPIKKMGEVAAKLLLEQLRGQATTSVELPTELVIRSSCAAIRKGANLGEDTLN